MLDRATTMARDLAEAALARQIALDVLEACRIVEPGNRMEIADVKIHARLLSEMCNYKDRLTAHVQSLFQRYMKEVQA